MFCCVSVTVGGLAGARGRAGWEHQRVAECKAGRRSGRKCAFSKLSLGKHRLILRYIPLVCNQDYFIPKPIHFICSAVKLRCFAKNHMPLKNPSVPQRRERSKKQKTSCVSAAIYRPFHVCQNRLFSREPFVFRLCVNI